MGFYISIIIILYTFVLKETAKWDDWTPWSPCRLRNGDQGKCWKDHNDPPQKKRTRVCITPEKDKEEVCNVEKKNCTELPICEFGKISYYEHFPPKNGNEMF